MTQTEEDRRVKRAYNQTPEVKAARKAHYQTPEAKVKKRAYNQSPKGRFAKHKANTKRRDVEFLLTFAEWWAIWEPHWEQRGNLGHELCMCRTDDTGPYEVGNVRIDTNANNIKEMNGLRRQ